METIFALLLATSMLLGVPALADTSHTTVDELYQGQGCSSCPPLKNLAAIAERTDVLALTFAVTSSDPFGQKDSFASPIHTERQWDGARGLNHVPVWTPQVIGDGRDDVVGMRAGEIDDLLAKASRPLERALTHAADNVAIGVGRAPACGADIWLVRYVRDDECFRRQLSGR
ncbi:DUF1223 domain-containing protein [Glacieibacterium megasporae]|uniref:DUF1223 domain-containing protein n=1 Tax=Glacieibacterium megasporae TaxID=2835787 RepID=UPI001C1DF210|nr:DUF1223 domain-containing protein [Polymorphobacter megasporae]UAJ10995.1 DUF1223 domain-containing protein [Polymorphobacter megasporae]